MQRRVAIPIRPARTLIATCFPTARSRRFARSIHETSLTHSTHWPAPHWCCGEYNIPRSPIARSCWICPHALSRLRIATLSIGITSVRTRDFLSRLVALTNFMRLSSWRGAHAALSSAESQEILGMRMEHRMKMGRPLNLDSAPCGKTTPERWKRETMQKVNKPKMRTRYRTEW